MRLSQAHCFDNNLINLGLNTLGCQHTMVIHKLPQHVQVRPLATLIISFLVLILHKEFGLLVDCVVSQVHLEVIQVLRIWILVFDSCKARKAIFVYIHAQWSDATNQNVNPQIELETIN